MTVEAMQEDKLEFEKEDDMPSVSTNAARSSQKASRSSSAGVVLLSRIPHGFYENEMKSYFSQFGTIESLRLSRSKKTGASKHYAFIKFKSLSVARIVAETMNNYLLSNRLLKCIQFNRYQNINFFRIRCRG
jgi:nucleolar protein 15